MGLYKAQFISMIIMILLGIGIFVGFNMEWVSIEENTNEFFEDTGLADFRIVSQTGYSAEDADKIKEIGGVDEAARYISVNVDVKERSGDSVTLGVTESGRVSGFMLMSGEEYSEESEDGIWLSDRYAKANDVSVGDKLTLVYQGAELDGVVKGLIKSGENLVCVRDESQIMPDYSTHGFAYISPAMYEKKLGFAFYPQINVLSDMEKADFIEKADEALGETSLILTREESASYSLAQGEVEEGQTMGLIMPVLFLLIGVLTMVTTMHRLTAKEKTQIGTLKALGFKNRQILVHYTSYAFMIGIIGSALGAGLGYALAAILMSPDGMLGTYFDIPEWRLCFPVFGYYVIGGIILLLTVIGFLSVKQMLKGNAADALRPYTPKKMKSLLIERTNAFHRLSFGTRWNMRDIMRHKSRTAMSLIGILGCMMIIVCVLGMSDTMNAFLDMYYDGATNYKSRIYLSETADNEARKRIIDEYDGDWSGSVSVQLGEKAISLDIYSVENDRVRFPDENSEFLKLTDDGALICTRISEEFGLNEGDSFTVSPYGSDDEYTLRVAHVMKSVSENVVVSPAYAEEIGFPYTISSVYTQTDKSEIAASDEIKSIQSKQMIIDSFDTFMELMNMMIVIFIVGAMVLGVVVLYNLGVMSYTERYREMATLKVVGFKDGKIGRLLIGQNLWVSLIGVIIGLPLGIAVLDYLMKALAPEYELNLYIGPGTYIFSILLTFGMSLIVSLMVARKNRRIDMVEALKGAE